MQPGPGFEGTLFTEASGDKHFFDRKQAENQTMLRPAAKHFSDSVQFPQGYNNYRYSNKLRQTKASLFFYQIPHNHNQRFLNSQKPHQNIAPLSSLKNASSCYIYIQCVNTFVHETLLIIHAFKIASISVTVLGQFCERLTGVVSVMRMLSSILMPMPRYFAGTDAS